MPGTAGYSALVVAFLIPLVSVTVVVLVSACLLVAVLGVVGLVALIRRRHEE